MLVTAFIQSSSATTVIVIGLVNAGLLTLKQSIGVIIGSNVGTTATAWLVSIAGFGGLSIEVYALPAIGLGFLLQVGGRSRPMKSVGTILLGFGLLFLGIEYLKEAFGPLQTSPRVQSVFVKYGSNPFFAILVGWGITMLVQSSSASIAIVQLLAMGGAFGTNWQVALDMAIPFVLCATSARRSRPSLRPFRPTAPPGGRPGPIRCSTSSERSLRSRASCWAGTATWWTS